MTATETEVFEKDVVKLVRQQRGMGSGLRLHAQEQVAMPHLPAHTPAIQLNIHPLEDILDARVERMMRRRQRGQLYLVWGRVAAFGKERVDARQQSA
jgi:hypothetical protein